MTKDARRPGEERAIERSDLLRHLREPVLTFVGLIGLLTINIVTGYLQPFPHVWLVNLAVMVVMIAVVLMFSMEVVRDNGLIRLFSVLGFLWVGILVTMTLIDYSTR